MGAWQFLPGLELTAYVRNRQEPSKKEPAKAGTPTVGVPALAGFGQAIMGHELSKKLQPVGHLLVPDYRGDDPRSPAAASEDLIVALVWELVASWTISTVKNKGALKICRILSASAGRRPSMA
jgi:hypothetical protein